MLSLIEILIAVGLSAAWSAGVSLIEFRWDPTFFNSFGMGGGNVVRLLQAGSTTLYYCGWVLPISYLWWRGRPSVASYLPTRRIAPGKAVTFTVAAILIGSVALRLSEFVSLALGEDPPQEAPLGTYGALGVRVAVIAWNALVAAAFEETLSRGFVYGYASQRWGISTAVLASTLSFVILHLRPDRMVDLTIAGLFLAFVRARTESLPLLILVHAAHNAFGDMLVQLR